MSLPAEYLDWLAGRPGCVRRLLRQFTPNNKMETQDGEILFLLGASECDHDDEGSCTRIEEHDGGELIVSRINPATDYEGAMATREYICGSCIEVRLP